LQVAHATSVQKRDALQDIINAALQPIALIQSQIEPIISQAQGLIQAVQTQIANVISSIIADLLAKANAVQAQIAVLAAIPGCAIGQAGNVTQIAIQAGMAQRRLFELLATFTVLNTLMNTRLPSELYNTLLI
jgi:hypothetical protein